MKYEFDKEVEAVKAIAACDAFLRLNQLPPLRFQFNAALPMASLLAGDLVQYNLASTRHPSTVRGWSYPGYKADRTVHGVLAHEVGHYIWMLRVADFAQRRLEWNLLIDRSQDVSGLKDGEEDRFAETMRLYILNPTLLRDAVMSRWEFLQRTLQLQPSVTRHWKDVLAGSPPHQKAAERWITHTHRNRKISLENRIDNL